jgi:hypothetical protein
LQNFSSDGWKKIAANARKWAQQLEENAALTLRLMK